MGCSGLQPCSDPSQRFWALCQESQPISVGMTCLVSASGQQSLVCVCKCLLCSFLGCLGPLRAGIRVLPRRFAGKDCLLESRVLLKRFPAKLAGGCAAGHRAGTKGLTKRSPAAGPPRGWQGGRGSVHRPGCRHCPGRLPAAAASSHPAWDPHWDPAVSPAWPAVAGRRGTGRPCKDGGLQRDHEANVVLSCSQHEVRSCALVGMHGTSRYPHADPDREGHPGSEQHRFSGGSSWWCGRAQPEL